MHSEKHPPGSRALTLLPLIRKRARSCREAATGEANGGEWLRRAEEWEALAEDLESHRQFLEVAPIDRQQLGSFWRGRR